jgi:lysophospholipase L1-like esterase
VIFVLKVLAAASALALAVAGAWWLLRARRGPAAARRVLLAAVTVTVSLLVALFWGEALVRLTLGGIGTTSDNTSWFARRWRAREVRSNTLGFREDESALARKSGLPRLVVVGDSFTWGQGVAAEARFTERLEHALRQSGHEIEVLNFGRPGTNTVDQIEVLEAVVLPLQPDWLLLQWFVNDVETGDPGGWASYWRLVPSDRIGDWLHRNSALYFIANQQWRELQIRAGFAPSFTRVMAERYREADGAPARAAREALETFIERCRAAGVPVGIAAFPHLAEPGDSQPLEFLLERVLEVCTARGVVCADMREAFDGEPRSRLWVNRWDVHPNARAHELAADHLLRVFGARWQAMAEAPSAPAAVAQNEAAAP